MLADPTAVARAAAERIAAALTAAAGTARAAHWATTGGSTPAPIYRALGSTPLREAVPWERVHLWWGDERFVPRDDPRSNARIADEVLLPLVSLEPANVHRWPCSEAIAAGRPPSWAAERYQRDALALVPLVDGVPAFDLVLLGVGPDGHILSVFPHSVAFDARAVALAFPAPNHIDPQVERVTFTPGIVDAAHALIVVAHGASKAGAVAAALARSGDERAVPARRARRSGATWLLDEAAAVILAVPRLG